MREANDHLERREEALATEPALRCVAGSTCLRTFKTHSTLYYDCMEADEALLWKRTGRKKEEEVRKTESGEGVGDREERMFQSGAIKGAYFSCNRSHL